ncbi:hypothetical protein BU23DRAFT_557209 [Bimuria novae-zelandiae CBS 107.79]|uniref:Secreted protein n=1 Tax=Bimuria novae-zelandiae CBS 107.79 TaxID=1447943 RepID=A0A6A5UZJ9_9PLEO|nr:hypothetical protein BU23DRAFT_557209 [Bimuria novae-zelandiae CBS 107.79]
MLCLWPKLWLGYGAFISPQLALSSIVASGRVSWENVTGPDVSLLGAMVRRERFRVTYPSVSMPAERKQSEGFQMQS